MNAFWYECSTKCQILILTSYPVSVSYSVIFVYHGYIYCFFKYSREEMGGRGKRVALLNIKISFHKTVK